MGRNVVVPAFSSTDDGDPRYTDGSTAIAHVKEGEDSDTAAETVLLSLGRRRKRVVAEISPEEEDLVHSGGEGGELLEQPPTDSVDMQRPEKEEKLGCKRGRRGAERPKVSALIPEQPGQLARFIALG